MVERPKVVVIGAGLAGLRCAERLTRTGSVDVVLLEAQERVGGRCWSSHGWADGQVGEHGGELIEPGQARVLALAEELGLPLESREAGRSDVRLVRHRVGSDMVALPGFADVIGALEEDVERIGAIDYRAPSAALVAFDEMTVADWIDGRVDGGRGSELGQVLEMSTCLGLGRTAPELSAVSLIHLWLGLPDLDDAGNPFRFGQNMDEDEEDEEPSFKDAVVSTVVDSFHVAGGNDLMAQALADRLPDGCLRLASPVASVSRRADGRLVVEVTGGSQPLVADRVVLAAPLGALGTMDLFGAELSQRRQDAFAQLLMGQHSKVLTQLDARPEVIAGWPRVGLFDGPVGVGWATSEGQPGDAGLFTLFAQHVVPPPVGGHGDADPDTRSWLSALLTAMTPGAADHIQQRVWVDSWAHDPWTGGSYAAFGPGHYSRYAGFMGQPEGSIHFAGEHTVLSTMGYLDGAVSSGERAARQVLSSLG
jgi:monoamine oxidase